MTRRITANLYMTIDGRGDFPRYPGHDQPAGDPDKPDPYFQKMWTDRYEDVTTVIMGRRSFIGHQRVHSMTRRKPNDPKFMFAYSRFLDKVEKVCLSHRLKHLTWENSRLMKGDLSRIVAKLKREKGGNIIAEGGPRLISEFIRRDLADDYWFLVMPVVLGHGPRYWVPWKTQTTLKLISATTMPYGELVLHFEAVHDKHWNR